MAFYDNPHWLLSHIRNSFISSDDTGMCEAILVDNIAKQATFFKEHDKYPSIEESSEDEDELSTSFDIQTEYDFGSHRQRTNTAQRLEKMEQEKRRAAKIRHVKWETPPTTLSEEEREHLFKRKEIKKRTKSEKVVSMLSYQIAKCPQLPLNPFDEYAKFDGSAQVGIPTRTYKIFLTMLPPSERNYPLQVSVIVSAKVQELIGFVCWKFITQNIDKNFRFKEDVNCYGLYIAEDDGEIDFDFSCLDPKETVGKFGLAYLALVELTEKASTEIKSESRPLYITESDRQRKQEETDDLARLKGDLTAIEALLFQTFQIHMYNKMRTKSEVILSISGDKIEIDPVIPNQTKVSGKIWKQRSLSYDISVIAACGVMEAKSSNKSIFRLIYFSSTSLSPDQSGSFSQSSSSNFKHHDFEAEASMAEDIVQKINHILTLKCSIHRREFLSTKQKKLSRRRSFSIWPNFFIN